MKIVVLDALTLVTDIDLAPIRALGETTVYDLTAPEEVMARVKDAHVILTNKVQLGANNLNVATKLQFIGLFATGFNNIDLDYAKERHIGVANVEIGRAHV